MKKEYQFPRVKVVEVEASASIMNEISATTPIPGED